MRRSQPNKWLQPTRESVLQLLRGSVWRLASGRTRWRSALSRAAEPNIRWAARVQSFELLSLCAELAIAITGFSGVVMVFGDRQRSASSQVQPFLFQMIFTGTLTPLGLIVIAFTLDAAAFEPSETWRICSALHVAAVVLLMIFGGGSSERRRAFAQTRAGRIVPVCTVLLIVLGLANVFSLHQFWPVLIGIWYGIGLGLFAFVQLAFSIRSNP